MSPKRKIVIAEKPEGIEALISFDWSQLLDEFRSLPASKMLVLDPRDFGGCTSYALREMVKSAIDRQRYFFADAPAATTHIDANGRVLVMRSMRVDVVPEDGTYRLPRRTLFQVAGNGERNIRRKRRRYEFR